MKVAAALAVALFALGFLLGDVIRHSQYTPDGFVYAWFSARDAGFNDRDALRVARATYEKTPLMAVPRQRRLIEMDIPALSMYARAFARRPLYPWLASLLLPSMSLRALFTVSALSYVVFGLTLFWLLSSFGRPWLAAILTMIALALPVPLTRGLAEADLTDMLAAVWWTLALGALLRLMHDNNNRALLVTLAIASILLTLTRPTPYLTVIPALAFGVLRRSWWAFIASCGGIAAYAIDGLGMPPFGLRDQWQWEYTHQPRPTTLSFQAWYVSSLVETVHYTLSEAVKTIAPFVIVVAGVYGIIRTRMRDELLILFAAMLACLIAVPLNPESWEVARTVAFPLIPVFAAIAQAVLCAILPEANAIQKTARPKPSGSSLVSP